MQEATTGDFVRFCVVCICYRGPPATVLAVVAFPERQKNITHEHGLKYTWLIRTGGAGIPCVVPLCCGGIKDIVLYRIHMGNWSYCISTSTEHTAAYAGVLQHMLV